MAPELPPQCAASPPWSAGQPGGGGVPSRRLRLSRFSALAYDDVLIWYDDLARAVAHRLDDIGWTRSVGDDLGPVRTTFRAKTIDTLREKLQRTPTISLGYVQDVAGVRIEANMSTRTQTAVARVVAATFGHHGSAIKDYRGDAHSGYRAVHVWLRLPAGRVEVQIRTDLQGQWANAFEALADVLGREIRYGGTPSMPTGRRLVETMISLSTSDLTQLEREGDRIRALRESLARVGESESTVASVQDDHTRILKAYHGLLVDLEAQFRSLRGR